jgi:hypothetical protein
VRNNVTTGTRVQRPDARLSLVVRSWKPQTTAGFVAYTKQRDKRDCVREQRDDFFTSLVLPYTASVLLHSRAQSRMSRNGGARSVSVQAGGGIVEAPHMGVRSFSNRFGRPQSNPKYAAAILT